jgi:hypothetical protein
MLRAKKPPSTKAAAIKITINAVVSRFIYGP